MATATFNTPIYSPNNQQGGTLIYTLDSVIDKDFEGPYSYTLKNSPEGVTIEINPKDGTYYMVIQPLVSGLLSVIVRGFDVGSEAITEIMVMPTVIYSEELKKLTDNKNYQQNLRTTKNNWPIIVGPQPPL